jgi:hypothetical protein
MLVLSGSPFRRWALVSFVCMGLLNVPAPHACTGGDCPPGLVCNIEPGGNVCLPPLCSSDADCGAGFACNGACYKICGAANPCAADCDTGDPCSRKACVSGLTVSGANICSIEPVGDPSGTLGCPLGGRTDDCNTCPACLGVTTTTTTIPCTNFGVTIHGSQRGTVLIKRGDIQMMVAAGEALCPFDIVFTPGTGAPVTLAFPGKSAVLKDETGNGTSLQVSFVHCPAGEVCGGTYAVDPRDPGALLQCDGVQAVCYALNLFIGHVTVTDDSLTAPPASVGVFGATALVQPSGTVFDVGYAVPTQQSTVKVTAGAVAVTPLQPPTDPSADLSLLKPRSAAFTLHAGEQVEVGPDTVGPIMPICVVEQCDDADPCTADSCGGTGCLHAAITGAAAVCSSCEGGVKSPACAGQPLPAMVARRFTQACGLEARVGTSKPSKAKKLKQQAAANLRKASALVKKAAKRHKGGVSAECAGVIAGILQGSF